MNEPAGTSGNNQTVENQNIKHQTVVYRTASDTEDSGNEDAELLWQEYQYRHEHIWSTIYKLTYTVAFLEVIPFLRPSLTENERVREVMLVPCILGLFLGFLGWIMISRELEVFSVIKARYRELHKARGEIPGRPMFESAVHIYFNVLVAAALITTMWVDLRFL